MDKNGNEKKAKTPRVPKAKRLLRKAVSDRVFQKKYLKKVGQKGDREFIASCFVQEEGAWKLKEGLDRETMVRLNKLAGVITGNRGGINPVVLFLFALIFGGVAVFGIVFMNPLIERGMELALQAAFGARAEVDGLRFDPFRMRLAVAGIRVADSAAPMTNLFQTARVEFRLNPAAIFRGKVWIEEAAAESIALGTPRRTSGALPGAQAPEATPRVPRPAEPPLVDFANFDAQALLESEKAKLESLKAYTAAGTAYDEASARWKARVETSRKAVDGAQAASKKALAIDVASIKTVAQATAAIEEVKRAIDAVKAVTAEAKAINADIQKDADTLAVLAKAAPAAVSADLAYLKSFVDPKSGAAMSALEPTIQAMLSDKAERYLAYGRRGLALLQDLRSSMAQSQADPEKAAKKAAEAARKARLAGRTVHFPSKRYPAFRLSRLVSQFPVAAQAWSVELKELTSDQDLVGSPTTLAVGATGGAFSLDLDARADFRRTANERYEVKAAVGGIALDLEDAFAKAGLSGFSGTLGTGLIMKGRPDGSMEARLSLDVAKPKVAAASGTLGKAVAQAMAETGAVKADALWSKAPAGGKDSFSLTTNLDQIVATAVTAMARQYAAKAMAEVEKVLRDYVARELEGKLGSKAEFDALFALAKGDASAVDTLKASLDKRLAELEAKAKAAATSAATGAASGVLGGTTLPSLPKLP